MNHASDSYSLIFKQAFLLFLSVFLFSTLSGSGNINDTWDSLLKKHVSKGTINGIELTVVDYEGLANDLQWGVVIDNLASATVPGDTDAKKAFWINAYNILAIKVVLSEYPLKSIKEVGPFYKQVWDLVAGKVAGEMYTLNHIEHKILRPLGDPLIHAAIVCASVSCPDLRTEAYVGNRVNAQLADQMRKFLTNPKKGAVFSKGKLKVSALFDFFTEDFIKSAGSLQSFLKTYVAEDMASKLSGSTKIDFMDYDWSLNDRKRARR